MACERRLRIAQVFWHGGLGGTQRFVRDIALSIDRSRFDVLFVALHNGGVFLDEIRGSAARCAVLSWRRGYDLSGRARLISLLRRFRPDVVHDHGVPPLVRPFVRALVTPNLVTMEHGDTGMRLGSRRQWPTQALQWLDFRAARLVIANSGNTASLLRRYYRLPEAQIELLRPGVDLDRFSPPHQPMPTHTELRLGYVGRIDARLKGVDQLPAIARELRSDQRISGFSIAVIGDGPDLPGLRARVSQFGVDQHFRYLGQVTDVLPDILRTLHIVVVPSRVEALGLTLLEALATGARVVAFDVGGLREAAGDCPDAALVPAGDTTAMARAIGRFWTQYGSVRSKAGPAYVRAAFDRATSTRKLEAVYERLAS